VKTITEISGNHTSSHLLANQEELGEGNDEFGLRSISLSILRSNFLHAVKSTT
jgi:hypothetical protein